MSALWCQKRGQRIFLQVCISDTCKQRKHCAAYAEIDALAEADAISDSLNHGHRPTVLPLPLWQAKA